MTFPKTSFVLVYGLSPALGRVVVRCSSPRGSLTLTFYIRCSIGIFPKSIAYPHLYIRGSLIFRLHKYSWPSQNFCLILSCTIVPPLVYSASLLFRVSKFSVFSVFPQPWGFPAKKCSTRKDGRGCPAKFTTTSLFTSIQCYGQSCVPSTAPGRVPLRLTEFRFVLCVLRFISVI